MVWSGLSLADEVPSSTSARRSKPSWERRRAQKRATALEYGRLFANYKSAKRGQENAYNIHLIVNYRIERGSLDDGADLDPYIETRRIRVKSPRNIERYRYRPFRPSAQEVEIGPTVVDIPHGYEGKIEEDVFYLPERPEPYPGYYDRLSARIEERYHLGVS